MKLHKRFLVITIFAWLLGSAFVSLPAEAQSFAYVTNEVSSDVSVINTATNTVVATVPVGLGPGGVAITPNGAFAYVANFNSADVSVINTATNTVVATVPVGVGLVGPSGVAVANIPSKCREDDGEDHEGDGHEHGDDGHHNPKPPCKHTGEDGDRHSH